MSMRKKSGEEKILLTDSNVKPENDVLEKALGKNYKIFAEFASKINAKSLVLEWRYYNDGKSWLGKILNKKKNHCWLSVWNTGFKITFFLTEKTISGIQELKVEDEIKNMAKNNKPVGKLLPIIILVENKKKLNDCLNILEYKMKFK